MKYKLHTRECAQCKMVRMESSLVMVCGKNSPTDPNPS